MTETIHLVEQMVTARRSVPMKAFHDKDDAEDYIKRSDKQFVIREIELV